MLSEHETEEPKVDPDSADLRGQERGPEADASGRDGRGFELQTALEERDRALAEKAELLDKFQRAQAEFENWRKRMMREKQETQEYAAMHTIESLLPIVDDFERAIETPGLDAEVKKGLELIYGRIIDVFTRAGMKPIEVSGEFDPHLHHAVDRAPAESDEHDQTILEVYQKGYHFKDRLLRPAMVKVAVKE
jgi:molecular chaperone GrpE